MKDNIGLPALPIPSHEYDFRQQFDFHRTLDTFFRQLLSPGHCEIATIRLTHLPTSSTGLKDNTVFVENGYLKLSGSSQAGFRKAGTATIADTTSSVSVTFATAYPNADYAVAIGSSGNTFVWITGKAASGFTLNRSGTTGALNVDWIAIPYSDL